MFLPVLSLRRLAPVLAAALLGTSMPVLCETISTTSDIVSVAVDSWTGPACGPALTYPSALEACASVVARCGLHSGRTASVKMLSYSSAICHYTGPGYDSDWGTASGVLSCPSGYALDIPTGKCYGTTCPVGQNYTKTSATTCTRPDCVSPEVRDPATGICQTPCPAGETWTATVSGCSCPL